jgi:hypothetical protein
MDLKPPGGKEQAVRSKTTCQVKRYPFNGKNIVVVSEYSGRRSRKPIF